MNKLTFCFTDNALVVDLGVKKLNTDNNALYCIRNLRDEIDIFSYYSDVSVENVYVFYKPVDNGSSYITYLYGKTTLIPEGTTVLNITVKKFFAL